MRVTATQKLYFNKFVYSVKWQIETPTTLIRQDPIIKAIKSQFIESGKPYRSRIDWNFTSRDPETRKVLVSFNVYFNDKDLYNAILVSPYANSIQHICKPIDDTHCQLLLDGTEIIFREKLWYNRFRYKVDLYLARNNDDRAKFKDWLTSNFEGRVAGRTGDYFIIGNYSQTLYLKDDQDLVMVKLCHSDIVYNIARVDTFAEHGMSSEELPI